jgi:hypothetical protein
MFIAPIFRPLGHLFGNFHECRLAAHSRSWSSGMGCSCSSQFFPQFTRLVLSFTDNLRHTRNSFLTHPSLKV